MIFSTLIHVLLSPYSRVYRYFLRSFPSIMSEEIEFPKTIEGFGYKFNEKGELRNIETGMLTDLLYIIKKLY
jgi:hypothetical protein